jgi:hypothetical protein
MAGEYLTGRYRIRAIRPAFNDADSLVSTTRERIQLRRHALKLRFWPDQNPTDLSGKIVDLDWSWVRSIPSSKIGELRVHDVIGGNDNLRIIFFVGPAEVKIPLPQIWILRVLQKKRDDFSAHEISIFKARRDLVLERFYNSAT